MSLLERAKEAALRARERAQERLNMYGDEKQEEMEGGCTENKPTEELEGGARNLARAEGSTRTFVAEVNGQLLGELKQVSVKRTDKAGGVSVSRVNRFIPHYFTGTPVAAAKKVISSVNKIRSGYVISKGTRANQEVKGRAQPMYTSVGIDNAIAIKLLETTRKVRSAESELGSDCRQHPTRYIAEYFGWREKLESPKAYVRGGKPITSEFKTVIIPRRGALTALEAVKVKECRAQLHPKIVDQVKSLWAKKASKRSA